MDPLNDGDNGALGGVFDTITNTVNSVERFGQTVQDATSFSMTAAMIWAVIIFMFLSLFARLGRPWSEAGAERWRTTGRVLTPPTGQPARSKDQQIADLEDRVAELVAQVAALTAAGAQQESSNAD